ARAHAGWTETPGLPWVTCGVREGNMRMREPARSVHHFVEMSRDHDPLHVARALVDLAYAHIPADALDRILGDITIASMDLQRVGTYPFSHLRREQLGHGGLAQTWPTGIAQGSRMQHHLSRDFDSGRHV